VSDTTGDASSNAAGKQIKMLKEFTYQIFPLGDSAATVQLGATINESINKRIISLFHHLQNNPIEGCKEVVPAYNSFTVYFDVLAIKQKHTVGSAFDFVKRKLEEVLLLPANFTEKENPLIRIPVVYGGDDLAFLANKKNLSIEEVIGIHCSAPYRVYISGFLPGFAYMGEVDERIAIGRKDKPMRIEPGSIGIAGRQTGIYPFQSPGGWYILGKTPLQIFDIKKETPALLHAGDYVQFYPIAAHEFTNY
jgi:inhibitor of KinA